MAADEFAALKEDIRQHGVKVPILVHGGQILDGRHRFRACRELGIPCRTMEWNGHDPWLEVQSRNLLRRHLAKEQIYAIRKLALQQFPELAEPIAAARAAARARRAQAKGRPRGEKAVSKSDDARETADVIGAFVGVSGTTVKRVDRLARQAPTLLPKVAAGEISARRALRDLKEASRPAPRVPGREESHVARLQRLVRAEWGKCPREDRVQFLKALRDQLRELVREHTTARRASGQQLHPKHSAV
jgi:ParB-like chromosome segregation protein Spo0J